MAMCGCPDCTGVDVLAEVDSPELPIKAWYEEVGDLSTVRNRSVGFNRREGDVALVLESDALTGFSVRDTRIGELEGLLRSIKGQLSGRANIHDRIDAALYAGKEAE